MSKLKLNVLPVKSTKTESDTDEHTEEYSSESVETEEENGFYVEMTLSCLDENDDPVEHNIVFNFGSENKYMDHAETGFDELDTVFEDAILLHFPMCTYNNEWDELCVHGTDEPDSDVIVDV